MFQATAAVQVSCQGQQMDLHRIPSHIPSPLLSLRCCLLRMMQDVESAENAIFSLPLSHSLALSDSSLPTPLKPSLSLCFRMQDALHSLSALHFQRSSDLKMKLDAPPSNWICTGEKI